MTVDDVFPSRLNFSRLIITRKHLLHYDQYLDAKISLLHTLINFLTNIEFTIQKHRQENRDLLITNPDLYQFCISSCEYDPDSEEINVWDSIDQFIKECNEFITNSYMKLNHDLRSADCRDSMTYNFKELESIKKLTKHSS